MLSYYCWHCYGLNAAATGRCPSCGQSIEPPQAADLVDRLLWACRHPNPDVAVMAARRLGGLCDGQAAAGLRALLDVPPDPYVAAEALRSLLKCGQIDALGDLLRRWAANGPILLRAEARDALASRSG